MEEKIVLGTNRPLFEEFMKDVTGYIACSCGTILQTRQASFEHWQLGHFDYLVYATKEEILNRVAEKIVKKENIE